MAGDLDALTERWRRLARDAGLPALDEGTIRLAVADAAGPGDALHRLVLEAVRVRRRRVPRTTASGDGELAVIFDPLGRRPPWLPARQAARLRREAICKIVRAAGGEVWLPVSAFAEGLGIPPRTLRRWLSAGTAKSTAKTRGKVAAIRPSASSPMHTAKNAGVAGGRR
jgi:hypothetical protein